MAKEKKRLPQLWEKGQSGNPAGRPRKLPMLDFALAQVLGEQQNDMTALETILKVLRNKAIKGDNEAAKILLERAYGKPKQQTDVRITDQPFVIELTTTKKSNN